MIRYTTGLIRSEANFRPYAAAWEALRRAQARPSLEQRAEWLPIEVASKAGATPAWILLFRGGELAGGAPFVLRPWTWHCRFGYRRVASFPLRLADACGETFLTPDEPEAQRAILQAIAGGELASDMVYLESLPTASALSRAIDDGAAHGLWVHNPRPNDPHWLLRMPPTFDAYMASLPGDRRSQLRRRAKKIEKDKGPITFVRVTAPADVAALLRDVEHVSSVSWQGTKLQQVVEDSDLERRKLTAHAERGWLRAYLLKAGEQPIAFVLGSQSDGIYNYEQLGYDPTWSSWAPGTVLLYRLIEDLYAHDSPSVLDFGTGHNEYKRRYGSEQFESRDLWLLRRSAYMGVARAVNLSITRVEFELRDRVKRWGLDARLRQLLRRGPAAADAAPKATGDARDKSSDD